MLEQIAKHGGIDLAIKAEGDLKVDQHHTVEDVAIALGEGISGHLAAKRELRDMDFCCPWMIHLHRQLLISVAVHGWSGMSVLPAK
jgi:imidazoleglycerol phosphate dehydratase HisB